jgi:sec-independent protein translocase protein TatC
MTVAGDTGQKRRKKKGAEHDPKEMGFLDHLEEFRWVLIRSIVALGLAAIAIFPFSGWIFEEILIRPLHTQFPQLELIYLKPAGNFMAMLTVSLWSAVLVALPYIAFELWRFIIPGLFQKERRLIPAVIVITVLCFAAGAAMAYFVVLPYALRFFLTFGSEMARPQLEIKEYLAFAMRMILAFGVVFELPVVSFFLSRLGIVTPALMRKTRPYAIFIIAALSAAITPPDPATMIMLLLPLVLLYELSILVAGIGKKKSTALTTTGTGGGD